MTLARLGRAVALGVLGGLLGCTCPTRVNADKLLGPPPTTEEIRTLLDSRGRSLITAEARGSAEFRWSDAEGNHFENGDFDFSWRAINGELQTAARLSKVGQRILWIGSSGAQWWFFDLASKVHTLHQGRIGSPSTQSPCGFVDPAELLRLIGVSVGGNEPIQSVEWDDQAGAWRVTQHNCLSWMKPSTLEVVRVELLREDGTARASCQLDEYAFVEAANMAHGAQPRLATRAKCTIVASGTCPAAEIHLHFDRLRVPQQSLNDRLFDLEALIASLKPEVVEDSGGS